MSKTMRAARLHAVDTPFRIDEIPIPEPGPGDALIAVRACGIVPNMRNIVKGGHWRTLPALPAVMGLDTAGVIAKLGPGVNGLAEGDPVYVNPALSCGSCDYCRSGASALNCDQGALQGYFGFRPESASLLAQYPYGGFAEYTLAPARNLVKLSGAVSFEAGARFGYLGTAFAALKTGGAKAGDCVAIIGGTGTLGVNAVLFALAMGVSRIIPIARNAERLARIQSLAPARIEPVRIDGTDIAPRLRQASGGIGPGLILDCLAAGAGPETTGQAIDAMRRGGTLVNIGALNQPLELAPMRFMSTALAYRGSNWFNVADGQEMVALAEAGLVDFETFEHRVFALEDVNGALAASGENPGGFVNIVVKP
jgi:threonine dehydrogenase-like Zn-dependent dehydrogenase